MCFEDDTRAAETSWLLGLMSPELAAPAPNNTIISAANNDMMSPRKQTCGGSKAMGYYHRHIFPSLGQVGPWRLHH